MAINAPQAGDNAATPEAREAPPFISRPTRTRLQTFFLRRFAQSGSVSDAAARAGITPRTVQRWRIVNPAFAARCEAVLARRVEILEDLAMRRACGADKRAVFHRGRQIATVERHNDAMLMRVLARFDKARLREQGRRTLDGEIARRVAVEAVRLESEYECWRAGLEREFAMRVEREVENRLAQMSRSTRQASDTATGP